MGGGWDLGGRWAAAGGWGGSWPRGAGFTVVSGDHLPRSSFIRPARQPQRLSELQLLRYIYLLFKISFIYFYFISAFLFIYFIYLFYLIYLFHLFFIYQNLKHFYKKSTGLIPIDPDLSWPAATWWGCEGPRRWARASWP